MKIKYLAIALIALMLLVPVFQFLPVGVRATYGAFAVDYPKGNSTFTNYFRTVTGGVDAINGYGGDWEDFNPNNVNYNLKNFIVTSHFNDFTYYNYPNMPLDNWINVTSVFAIVRAYYSINEGWFSVRYNTTTSWWDSTPWNPSAANYYNHVGVSYNSYGWKNSSLYPYGVATAFTSGGENASEFIEYEWNITSLYTWNYTMLSTCQYPDTSKGLNIMWTSQENISYAYFDYLGIRYTAIGNYTNLNPNPPLPPTTFNAVSGSIVWLLILYLPAIAMAQYIPKLGYVFGMALMLIILFINDSSFIPVTFVGFAALGILIYKGD